MNKSSIFGFLIVGVVLYASVFQTTKNPQIFFHTSSLILVLGGTLAVAFIAFPFASLAKTVDYLLWGFLFKKKREYLKVSQDIAGARSAFQNGQSFTASDDSHPFLKESVILLLNGNIADDGFEEVLRQRSEYFKKKYKDDAKVLISLAKYPPAFGLLGAAVGMIEMMNALSTGAQVNIGQTMMLAFASTFWGIAFSHFLILPLADSASKAVDDDHMLRSLIIDGVVLIRQRVSDDHFQAYMRGYLSLSDRSEFKIYSRKSILGYAESPKPNAARARFEEGLSNLDHAQPIDFNRPYEAPISFDPVPAPVQTAPEPVVNNYSPPRPVETDPLAFEQFKASIRESSKEPAPQPKEVAYKEPVKPTPPPVQIKPNNPPPPTAVESKEPPYSQPQKMVAGSDVSPPPPTEVGNVTITAHEVSGRVEEPVKLKANIEISPQQFKFKDLRKEMKKTTK
jgi:chemotaxis protein MotA